MRLFLHDSMLYIPLINATKDHVSNLDLVQMLHRLDVLLLSSEEVVNTSDDQDAAKHDDAPVHVCDSG